MRIDVLTLFPEMFRGVIESSMLGRASQQALLDIRLHNIRDYAANKHKQVDDYPFGGGAGLVMMAQPIYDCVESVLGGQAAKRILLTPRGRLLTPAIAKTLSREKRLLLLCGHYEGVDERVMDIMDDEISMGDYVLTGGELPAMVLIDCLSRFIPGVLGSSSSTDEESFSAGLLEYPQYTRPADFRGKKVPEILLNGHHARIADWRYAKAVQKTQAMRPELLRNVEMTKGQKEAFLALEQERE